MVVPQSCFSNGSGLSSGHHHVHPTVRFPFSDCLEKQMMTTYTTADQFCHGMSYREWRANGHEGRCPHHAKMLRNFNKAEAYDIAKRNNMHAFFCTLSQKWHLATGSFDPKDFEVADGQ